MGIPLERADLATHAGVDHRSGRAGYNPKIRRFSCPGQEHRCAFFGEPTFLFVDRIVASQQSSQRRKRPFCFPRFWEIWHRPIHRRTAALLVWGIPARVPFRSGGFSEGSLLSVGCSGTTLAPPTPGGGCAQKARTSHRSAGRLEPRPS